MWFVLTRNAAPPYRLVQRGPRVEDGYLARPGHRARRCGGGILACLCALALCGLALEARPALADGTDPNYPGSVLHVTTSGTPVVGSELTITATGSNAPQEPFGMPYGMYDLELFAVDHTLLPVDCSQSFETEDTIYTNNPQAVNFLTFGGLNEGVSGPFTIQLPVPATNAGDWLVCAYSVFIIDDAAWASTEVKITANAKPAATVLPRISRSGSRLRCSPGIWSGSPTSYAYRWLVVHKAGVAGRRSSLSVTHALRGRAVECSVTATNSVGSTTATGLPFKVH